jgi:hypothetical protein
LNRSALARLIAQSNGTMHGTTPSYLSHRAPEREMTDERVIGSAPEIEGIKNVPSLALALFPRPELLVAGDSWRVSGGCGDGTGGKAQNVVDPGKDSTGGQ